jgi:hypothetical protein
MTSLPCVHPRCYVGCLPRPHRRAWVPQEWNPSLDHLKRLKKRPARRGRLYRRRRNRRLLINFGFSAFIETDRILESIFSGFSGCFIFAIGYRDQKSPEPDAETAPAGNLYETSQALMRAFDKRDNRLDPLLWLTLSSSVINVWRSAECRYFTFAYSCLRACF